MKPYCRLRRFITEKGKWEDPTYSMDLLKAYFALFKPEGEDAYCLHSKTGQDKIVWTD